MKKWMIALAVLCGSSQAFALTTWKINCTNENQQSLQIEHEYTRLTTVKAALTTPEFSGSFVGTHTGLGYDMAPMITGEEVSLQVVKPRDHGGRCGRCMNAVWPKDYYYAKLKVGSQEYNFTCYE